MKRRKFLTITGIGSAVAAFTSFKFVSTSFENATARLIKNQLDFLKLDEEGLERFVNDFAKENKSSSYRMALRGYAFIGVRASQSGKVNQLVTTYLLSTDFFQNKMDENKIIKYMGLYDAHKRPCAHPFSHFYYPDASA
jgi:hypothetical protein